MNYATWKIERKIVASEPFELPERFRTKCGYQLVRLPDILRVNGVLYISKRTMDKVRRRIALNMQKRMDEQIRSVFYNGVVK